MAAVLIAVRRVRGLVPRTLEALDLLGRELRPALVRVRDEADAARARRPRAKRGAPAGTLAFRVPTRKLP
jgi:hypothetical protein